MESFISSIYRCFKCQHHLIQETGHVDIRPDIPSLTPGGFETWARVMIEAYPNTEYKRLQKALELFQIRDKGGLPIIINRSLFPEVSDLKIRDYVKGSIENHNTAVPTESPTSLLFPASPPLYDSLTTNNHSSHNSHPLSQPPCMQPTRASQLIFITRYKG